MARNEVVEKTVETAENVETSATTPAVKRPKKLSKDASGVVVKITVLGGQKGEMLFDSATLPQNVRDHLIPFGLGHKLGDSAAGSDGVDAETAIQKVWEGLQKGDWSVRAPAAPKVSLNDIKSNLANLSGPEKDAATALLKSLGITV